MSEPVELSRLVKVRPHPPQTLTVTASADERAALARRFGISAIETLVAHTQLAEDGAAVLVTGTLTADLLQPCAVSGEDFAVAVSEPIDLRFVPAIARAPSEEEIDLTADELDEIEYAGDAFDLGEAIAQTLGLAIDPYAEGPGAAAARAEAGITTDDAPPRGPLADLLEGLKPKG